MFTAVESQAGDVSRRGAVRAARPDWPRGVGGTALDVGPRARGARAIGGRGGGYGAIRGPRERARWIASRMGCDRRASPGPLALRAAPVKRFGHKSASLAGIVRHQLFRSSHAVDRGQIAPAGLFVVAERRMPGPPSSLLAGAPALAPTRRERLYAGRHGGYVCWAGWHACRVTCDFPRHPEWRTLVAHARLTRGSLAVCPRARCIAGDVMRSCTA